MRRHLIACCVFAFLSAPAAAQPLNPAGPAPRPVSNWINVGTADDGTVFWFDANSINFDGYYRSAEFRIDLSGGARDTVFLQFDCDGGQFRVEELRTINGYPTRVPATGWIHFSEDRSDGRVVMASMSREKLCIRAR